MLRPMIILSCLLTALGIAATEPAYPGDSIYQVKVTLADQAGKPATLDRYAGQPTIVSMFYASCPHVCPMLVASVRRLQQDLPPAERARLRVLLVSFDPKDTPAALTEVLAKQGIDAKTWTLATTSVDEVRLVAAALGIRYRQLPDGGFSHSTILTLLDAQGRPLKKTDRFTDPEPEFRAALAQALTK